MRCGCGRGCENKPDRAPNTTAERSWPPDNLANNISRLSTHFFLFSSLLFFSFLFFIRGLPQIASLALTKESGKLKLNFIGRYEQTQSIIGMAALIQINNQHQREVKHGFDRAGDPSVELKAGEMELWITEMKRLFLFFFTLYSNSSSFLPLLLLVC